MAGRFSNLEFDEQAQRREQERDAVQLAPSERSDYLKRAHEEYRWGQFETALRLYTRCLQDDRKVIPAWVGQVQMLVQLEEYHEARLWADKALEMFRSNGELLAAKAQACVRLNDFTNAYACSDAALQAPDSSAWRWEVRGELLLAQDKKQFDTCFEKALVEPAADWFDRVIIARILMFHRRAAAAMVYLRKATELEPGHAYTWLQLGQCEEALGMVAAAQNSYEHCLELRPVFTPARQALDALGSGSPLGWLRGLWQRWRQR